MNPNNNNTPNPINPNQDLLFVDRSVNDYQSLNDGIVSNTPETQLTVIELELTEDGIQQISDALMQYEEEQISA